MSRQFLLTGATGVVGLSMIELLDSNDSVVAIVNRRRFQDLPTGVSRQILGDIRKPMFGLSESEVESLRGKVNCLVHSAALTDFTADPDALAKTNISGLMHAQALAEHLGIPLVYISTAFVQGRNGHELNNYELSKRQAEDLVDEQITVVRPSVIIGDRNQGIMPKKQGLHNVLRLASKEVIPIVPGDMNTLVDVIPRDVVGKAILAIIDYQLKGEFWLTAGKQASTLGDLIHLGTDVDLVNEFGIGFTPPKLMNPKTFERLVKPVFMPALPRRYRRMFEEASIYLKYLDMSEGFKSDLDRISHYSGDDLSFNIKTTLAMNLAAFETPHALIEKLVEEEAA